MKNARTTSNALTEYRSLGRFFINLFDP